MQFQASDTLKSRTFIGLLIAQFLAAFNDQAIHASAMFYAISQNALSEAKAISLMPILFFAPWAIFCTLAGYLADRFSKRASLVFWKVAEVGITLVALLGFWLGSGPLHSPLGPYLVLSTVFLMGTHSAFFVPAKYGVMPEILQPHLLSRGNGLLESLSFLAVILGTVTGGILSSEFLFKGQEYYIGLLLVGLAIIGAVASLLIHKMPAADPTRPFPKDLFRPLFANLQTLIRSRPLALAVLGIAFFTFVVAFMRATVYMLGESHVPRWSEYKTSVVVGMSALGIGLGSPLAGYLSGGKVELGLVPLGAIGMIGCTLLAAVQLHWLPGLVGCIIAVGFFTGFFIVPLFTLLQHRAPKASKGALIATSNFINVVGAIAASILFFALVTLAHLAGFAPKAPQKDLYVGTLTTLELDQKGRMYRFDVDTGDELVRVDIRPHGQQAQSTMVDDDDDDLTTRMELTSDLIHVFGRPGPGSKVAVSTYTLEPTEHRPRGLVYYRIRPADMPMEEAYDDEGLPAYLFAGAALMTLVTLILLCRQLPDFFVRALLWLRTQGRYRLLVFGGNNLPSDGPVILATNCDRFESCLQVVAATDRFTRFVLWEVPGESEPRPLLRYLANRTGLIALRPGQTKPEDWGKARLKAAKTLDEGNLLGLSLATATPSQEMAELFEEVRHRTTAPILPVLFERAGEEKTRGRWVKVTFGAPLAGDVSFQGVVEAVAALGQSEPGGTR